MNLKANPMTMKFALAVPTLNAGQLWEKWLEAVDSQTLKADQLIILDTKSIDGTPEKATASGYTVIDIEPCDFDHAGTRQIAVEHARDLDFIVFLSQDSILANHESLRNLLAPFENIEVGAVYGRQLPREKATPYEEHARLFNYPQLNRLIDRADIPSLGIRAAFFSNAFGAYRLETLKTIGGFYKGLILGEDTDAAARILLSGKKIYYQAEATVIHSHGYGILEECRRYFDIGVFHTDRSYIKMNFSSFNREGWHYLVSELKYSFKRAPVYAVMSLIRSLGKYVAFRLGLRYRYIPNALRIRFSMNRRHWRIMRP